MCGLSFSYKIRKLNRHSKKQGELSEDMFSKNRILEKPSLDGSVKNHIQLQVGPVATETSTGLPAHAGRVIGLDMLM